MDVESLPHAPSLVRVGGRREPPRLALWREGSLRDLSAAPDARLQTLDRLLALPLAEARQLLDDPDLDTFPRLDPTGLELLAPVESQEVWASGVTYLRSREARVEEATSKDIYTRVYEAERPELFFKANGWRVVPPHGAVGVRSDSEWDVPEPELAVLANSHGEVIGYSCGNDMSSRSIEGENPLYLPQAKVYDASCSIGPAAVLAWHLQPEDREITLRIQRDGREIVSETASTGAMVRDPAGLASVLYACYTLPAGAWLLTGTGIVPSPYTAQAGDVIHIHIDGIGELVNDVRVIQHSGAAAPPLTM